MKTFKFSIAIIVLALFISKSFAQGSTLINGAIDTSNGIYLTASDFNHNSLDLSGDKSNKNTFHLNDFFGGKKITVSHDGKKYQFSKDIIFGYRDKDGIAYRFFKDHTGEYKILENKKAVIYERRFTNGKAGFKTVYYFSKGAEGDIYVLSIDNLKKVFKGEPAFDVIDINFHTDGDLLSYDQIHHEYRINYYLSKIDPDGNTAAKAISSNNAAVQHINLSDRKVVENGAIVIYESMRPGDKLNLFKPVVSLYFSVKGFDQVYSLTLKNLKSIYRDGQAFDVLDTNFRTDSGLLAYDSVHHQYLVNYYLSN